MVAFNEYIHFFRQSQKIFDLKNCYRHIKRAFNSKRKHFLSHVNQIDVWVTDTLSTYSVIHVGDFHKMQSNIDPTSQYLHVRNVKRFLLATSTVRRKVSVLSQTHCVGFFDFFFWFRTMQQTYTSKDLIIYAPD